jgi:hypothetical protein
MRFPSLHYLGTMIDATAPIDAPDPLFIAVKQSLASALNGLACGDNALDVIAGLARCLATDLLVYGRHTLSLTERAELKCSLRVVTCCPGCPGWAVFNEGSGEPRVQRCDECFSLRECWPYTGVMLKLSDEEAAALPEAAAALKRAVQRVNRHSRRRFGLERSPRIVVIDVEVES